MQEGKIVEDRIKTISGGTAVIIVAVLEILFVAMLIVAMALAVWKDIHRH